MGLWLYVLCAFGLGGTALFGGGSLLLDPSGSTLGMPVDWLADTPFDDYTIPGAILFAVLGIGPFVVLAGIARRARWAWPATLSLGIVLVGWIGIQMLLLETANVLHAIYGGLGAVLVGLALLPSVRADLGWREN